MSMQERRLVMEETRDELGKMDLEIFTDGSVEGGVKNGGGAFVFRKGEEQVVRRRAAGRWSSSYEAEMVAMEAAVEELKGREESRIVIYTDSQALVRALRSRKPSRSKRLERIKGRLAEEGRRKKIVIQWVPGHVGIEGIEWADREANTA